MTLKPVDVFIVGSGSAGLSAALYLSICGISYQIVDSRSGPLEVGQADGVQCRTVEIFESFGLGEEMCREGYWVNEVAFWNDDRMEEQAKGEDGRDRDWGRREGIRRVRRAADTETGLSHCPHVILNQARVNELMLGKMRECGGGLVEYGVKVKGVSIDEVMAREVGSYAVSVSMEKDGKEQTVRARYVLGCDGAHSAVRKSMGIKMIGDSSDSIWGVMDIYPRTNFPDIRRKCVLQSQHGSIIVIPREGQSLCRLYIELPSGTVASSVNVTDLQTTARKIFFPYTLDFSDIFWWSAYSIGQRLAERFALQDRVFLTGDACHTHSPKAGQGMNVSLQDGYNIGWKLALVLKKLATPALIQTYTVEREEVARDLINFDRIWTKAMSSKGGKDTGKEDFSEIFVQAGRYTAGLTTRYRDSMITKGEWSRQELAPKIIVGMRFPSKQVVRFCDVKAMQLIKALPSDGRWRIVVFAGDIKITVQAKKLHDLAVYLESKTGPGKIFTPRDADVDSLIEPILVLANNLAEIEQDMIPSHFSPVTGKWRMKDLHKTFIDDESYNHGHGHAYEFYEVAPSTGAVVIVRPDQYVSLIIGLEDRERIGRFFENFLLHQDNR